MQEKINYPQPIIKGDLQGSAPYFPIFRIYNFLPLAYGVLKICTVQSKEIGREIWFS
jgi:hypothetical protein